jgi:hypothetical protein
MRPRVRNERIHDENHMNNAQNDEGGSRTLYLAMEHNCGDTYGGLCELTSQLLQGSGKCHNWGSPSKFRAV